MEGGRTAMDWEAAIEWNRAALARMLAALVAMAGLGGGEPASALPRHLHRAVLRLLRPAEAAARRLVIAAARGLAVALPRKPAPGSRTVPAHGTALPVRPRSLCLSLFDPLPRFGPARPVPAGVPRISAPGFTRPFFIAVRPSPSPGDPVDAARLGLRLAALGRVLDDLPRHAKRFARWRARLDRARHGESSLPLQRKHRAMRVWPLRPGRPPGSRRRPGHEVDVVLKNTHGLAVFALGERRDTS